MYYLDYTEVERYCNIMLEENGVEYVNSLIPAVEDYVDTACNRTWKVTEILDGNTGVFFPKQPPIDEITSVTVDDTALDLDEVYNYYDSLFRTHYLTASGSRCRHDQSA